MPELIAVPSCCPGELVGYEAPMSVRCLLLSSCGQSVVWLQKMGVMGSPGITAVASRTTDRTKTLETFIFSFNFFTFSRFAPDESMDGQL